MPRGSRFAVSVTIQCALTFLLAFAVFGWGLHAKLSLYEANPHSHSVSATAKLATKERPSEMGDVRSVEKAPAAGVEAFASRSVVESMHLAAIEPTGLEQVEVVLRAPFRASLGAPTGRLRPPPARV